MSFLKDDTIKASKVTETILRIKELIRPRKKSKIRILPLLLSKLKEFPNKLNISIYSREAGNRKNSRNLQILIRTSTRIKRSLNKTN